MAIRASVRFDDTNMKLRRQSLSCPIRLPIKKLKLCLEIAVNRMDYFCENDILGVS